MNSPIFDNRRLDKISAPPQVFSSDGAPESFLRGYRVSLLRASVGVSP